MFANKRKLALLVCILALCLLATVPSSRAQEIKTIETRPGVTLPFLFHRPAASPKGVMVIFSGGDGTRMFRETLGRVHLGNNFLVRTSPEFVKNGYAVAIVDVPSDQASGMSPGFRTSPQHVQDIAKLIDFLDAQGLKPLYLVGTSMGTLSVASLGLELRDSRVKGLVLTSTVGGVGRLPLNRITLPVLMVHHGDDGCKFSPYRKALQLGKRISGSPKVNFVEVRGGDTRQSDPCNPLSYHGFLGVEDQVVRVITDWAAGKSIPPQVGR